MAHSRYQNGCLFVRGKRREMWVARWREEVILADGAAGRVMGGEILALRYSYPSMNLPNGQISAPLLKRHNMGANCSSHDFPRFL
jgi:hypothetical protein